MNIRPVRGDVVPPETTAARPATPAVSTPLTGPDSYAPAQTQNQNLVKMLQQQPDVRPEAVQRAQELAADPNYPSAKIVAGLAQLVIGDGEQE